MTVRSLERSLLFSFAALLSVVPAFAQDAAKPAQEQPAKPAEAVDAAKQKASEEIVVTARKR